MLLLQPSSMDLSILLGCVIVEVHPQPVSMAMSIQRVSTEIKQCIG